MGQRIGELLNHRWRIGARHALYHRDGVWYHQLRHFPGALCDPNGYVLFRTEADFRQCPHLRIEQDVNVQGHLSEIPSYVRVSPDQRYHDAGPETVPSTVSRAPERPAPQLETVPLVEVPAPVPHTRHWMFLTHPDNWEKCLQHGLFGFDQEYAYTVEHYIRPGDRAIIYLAQRSAIWGVVEITEVLLNQTEPIGWLKKGWEARKGARIESLFPARVRFRPLSAIRPPKHIGGAHNEARNLLEYITDKRRWNVFVQIALSRVPEADVATVLGWATEVAGR